MNPLQNWEELRCNEIREGGNPTLCIMGCDDYAVLCGAIGAVMNREEPLGEVTQFRGVTLHQSRAHKHGIMFA